MFTAVTVVGRMAVTVTEVRGLLVLVTIGDGGAGGGVGGLGAGGGAGEDGGGGDGREGGGAGGCCCWKGSEFL